MRELPENKFGYLVLKGFDTDKRIFAKADKVAFLTPDRDGATYVTSIEGVTMMVTEKPDEIFEQLDNIHPSMR